jgi:hypothetical protein
MVAQAVQEGVQVGAGESPVERDRGLQRLPSTVEDAQLGLHLGRFDE